MDTGTEHVYIGQTYIGSFSLTKAEKKAVLEADVPLAVKNFPPHPESMMTAKSANLESLQTVTDNLPLIVAGLLAIPPAFKQVADMTTHITAIHSFAKKILAKEGQKKQEEQPATPATSPSASGVTLSLSSADTFNASGFLTTINEIIKKARDLEDSGAFTFDEDAKSSLESLANQISTLAQGTDVQVDLAPLVLANQLGNQLLEKADCQVLTETVGEVLELVKTRGKTYPTINGNGPTPATTETVAAGTVAPPKATTPKQKPEQNNSRTDDQLNQG